MASVNKVILVGNLGKDPESRTTQDGRKVVSLSLATSERWKDRHSGESREVTEWHRVVILNDALGELAERHLRKGSKVYIQGKLQTRKYTAQDGVERHITEIVLGQYRSELVLLDSRNSGERDDTGTSAPPSQPASTGTRHRAASSAPLPRTGWDNGRGDGSLGGGTLDDEIPF